MNNEAPVCVNDAQLSQWNELPAFSSIKSHQFNQRHWNIYQKWWSVLLNQIKFNEGSNSSAR